MNLLTPLSARIAVALALAAAPATAGAEPLNRPGAPVVLQGADLQELSIKNPSRLVAFRRDHGWKQVPVQVDERLVVDFGSQSFGPTGVTGTVYGTPAVGTTALQYADPNTFVGPDPDPTLDADDEVAFIASDGGSHARPGVSAPAHVARHTSVEARVTDPVDGGRDFVYLFRSDGSLDSAAGKDYVRYAFNLTSGDYRSTYQRADGPNPETSSVVTKSYRAEFSDRWMYDQLHIHAGPASGVDISDGFKFGFAPGNCGRSEATFDDAEGAFVANVDGPVRAIRSYVGANSGPYTERTDYFYPRTHEIVTDLRVHPITGLFLHHDLSTAAFGMTYRDSANTAGVPVDGVNDAVDASHPADWHQWTGPQGTLTETDRFSSTFEAAIMAAATGWYLDDSTPAYMQCWGDSEAIGQAGFLTTASIPNTDPHLGTAESLRAITTEEMGPPGGGRADAARFAAQVDSPLTDRVRALG